MSGNQQVSSQRAPGAAPPGLPDLNAQTYPYEVVLGLLDQAAYFNLIMTPVSDRAGGDGGAGFEIYSALHRFESSAQPPTQGAGMRVTQAFGESLGTFRSRWSIISDDFVAGPGREPPRTTLDRSRSQRFAMQEGTFLFGDGKDGFRGFGTGRTFPTVIDGQSRLLAGGVGTTLDGFGRFQGVEGTYVFNGVITPENQFRGNVAIRILDPDRTFRPSGALPPLRPAGDLDPGVTYIVLRGQKRDASVKSEYDLGPGGQVRGLITPAQMRLARYSSAAQGRDGVQSRLTLGQVVGSLEAIIYFDLATPPGTAYVPSPFTTNELYRFTDADGREVGTIRADVVEGESFGVRLRGAPGQPSIRFAGYGPIQEGAGVFEGVRGMLSVNSAIGISPHALSLMHVFRIIDPNGRYRPARGRRH